MKNAFVRIAIAAMATVLLGAPRIAKADITYTIQNYEAEQNGAMLSGFITTDGTIGDLAVGDIESWSFTITPAGGSAYTVNSSDAGSEVYSLVRLVASDSSLTLGAGGGGSTLLLYNSNSGAQIEYANGGPLNSVYDASIAGGTVWETPYLSNLGGTDPWVVATAAAVPEPSSVLMLALGTAFLAGFARRSASRRAA